LIGVSDIKPHDDERLLVLQKKQQTVHDLILKPEVLPSIQSWYERKRHFQETASNLILAHRDEFINTDLLQHAATAYYRSELGNCGVWAYVVLYALRSANMVWGKQGSKLHQKFTPIVDKWTAQSASAVRIQTSMDELWAKFEERTSESLKGLFITRPVPGQPSGALLTAEIASLSSDLSTTVTDLIDLVYSRVHLLLHDINKESTKALGGKVTDDDSSSSSSSPKTTASSGGGRSSSSTNGNSGKVSDLKDDTTDGTDDVNEFEEALQCWRGGSQAMEQAIALHLRQTMHARRLRPESTEVGIIASILETCYNDIWSKRRSIDKRVNGATANGRLQRMHLVKPVIDGVLMKFKERYYHQWSQMFTTAMAAARSKVQQLFNALVPDVDESLATDRITITKRCDELKKKFIKLMKVYG
jgi:hypothetical protein